MATGPKRRKYSHEETFNFIEAKHNAGSVLPNNIPKIVHMAYTKGDKALVYALANRVATETTDLYTMENFCKLINMANQFKDEPMLQQLVNRMIVLSNPKSSTWADNRHNNILFALHSIAEAAWCRQDAVLIQELVPMFTAITGLKHECHPETSRDPEEQLEQKIILACAADPETQTEHQISCRLFAFAKLAYANKQHDTLQKMENSLYIIGNNFNGDIFFLPGKCPQS